MFHAPQSSAKGATTVVASFKHAFEAIVFHLHVVRSIVVWEIKFDKIKINRFSHTELKFESPYFYLTPSKVTWSLCMSVSSRSCPVFLFLVSSCTHVRLPKVPCDDHVTFLHICVTHASVHTRVSRVLSHSF